MTKIRIFAVVLAVAVSGAVMFGNDEMSLTTSGSMISTANAVIGRPVTPVSYAGVARRTTRRAVVGGAALGAAAAAPVVVVPGCVQAVNSYGQLYWRCP